MLRCTYIACLVSFIIIIIIIIMLCDSSQESGIRDGVSGVRILYGGRIFLCSKASRPALLPTHPPIQSVRRGFIPRRKAGGC